MKKFYTLSTTILLGSLIAYSQPGSLDALFGHDGKVNTNIVDINKGAESINGAVIQPDGKIVAVGTSMSPGIILRYNANGTPDNSFDYDGKLFAYGYKFNTVALQPDGKIVAAGYGFGMVRLNSNGTYDNSFGTNGRVSITIGAYYSSANAMVIQPDGKIVLAGYSYDGARNQFALARFNTDGSPDNSFDSDGQLITDFGPSDEEIRGAAIQNDGKIVVAGYMYNGAGANLFAVARYEINGAPDNSFDGDGKLTTSFGTPDDYGSSVAIQTDGKIVVTGFTDHNLAIARYSSTGVLDNSFDGDGKATTVSGSNTVYPASIIILSDEKLLVSASTGSDFGLYRFNSNGSPDNSFDGDGLVTTDLSANTDYPTCLALQNNRIVVAGFSLNTFARDFSIACYTDNGELDNSFDGDGKLVGYFNTSYDIARAIAVQADGKVVAAGYTGLVDMGSNNDFALARYNTDGTPDNTFNGNGKVSLPVSASYDDKAYAVAIQTDGKIIAAGISRYGGDTYDVALVRFNTNGSLDNTFDGDGIAIIAPSTGNDIATSIAIQSDGKIVVAGSAMLIRLNSNGTPDNSFDSDGIVTTTIGGSVSIVIQTDGKIVVAGSSGGDFAVARYKTNGNLDNTFDADGIVTTDFGGATDAISSVTLQTDGKIVVAGMSNTSFAVARYTTSGTPDNTFDGDGKLTTDMGGSNPKVASVAVQANGKIVVAGETRNSNDDFVLARYNSNGTPDNSLDGDGKVTLDLGPGSYEHLWAMKISSNRIYLAGESLTEGAVDFVIAAVVSEPVAGPLPLQLRDFTGKRLNDDALLTWKTENESDMLEYIVERSIDGRNYMDIGTVTAENRAGLHNYNFTDQGITSLNTSVVYYRLRQKGIDGKYSYSRIIALALDKERNIVLFYPNPVINVANIALTTGRQDRLRVRIIDNKGRLVRDQQWNVAAGSSSLSIDVSHLASGLYYLEIKGENVDYRKRFVK